MAKIKDRKEIIREAIGREGLYEALAEEAAELSAAAAKMARKLHDTNPTPKSEEECYRDVLEEYADVKNVARVADIPFDHDIADMKMDRWYKRVTEDLAYKESEDSSH